MTKNIKPFLVLIVLSMTSSCASYHELTAMEPHYRSKVKEQAEFLLNCKEVKVSPNEYLYFHDSVGPLSAIPSPNKIPISYRVSGCNRRSIFLIVRHDRTKTCDANLAYKQGMCVPVQDSSFVPGSQNK